MDRVAAMLILLGVLVGLVLMLLALFAVAPVICSCLLSLIYTLYLFMAYEESGVHHAQEYENRFWTIFIFLLSTVLFFVKDSPLAFGRWYSPSLGFFAVVLSSYGMHIWDRYVHRMALSRQTMLRRSMSQNHPLSDMKVTVEDQMAKINRCLMDIDQLLIPSTINNFINERFVLKKEKEIISVFLESDAVALNYLVCHLKLGLLIYKIKDHRNFAGQHRTELIELLAVDRLPALTVMSRVIVLHALQVLKLRANPRAEQWVRNIIINTYGDDLSAIKSLTDAKGDYFCMNKLIFDDIRSETVQQDILNHIRKEGAMQLSHMQLGTKRAQQRQHMAWRKVLSDVDDTLLSSGGSYPAGVDKRFSKKVVYPGVLAFYRELDLGVQGPEEWPDNEVGNLVFLSARPHFYKDMSERANFRKFERLRKTGADGRPGMHTTPSLLAGDLVSGSQYIATNDFDPLAKKKFDNFKRYVSIYPEYQHVFVCDNGQGDVRAGEMMFDSFPYEFEAMYVHVVQDRPSTFGYAPERWRNKEFAPCFFTTYPQAALHAATRSPPLIRISGLQRVCSDAAKDFYSISKWHSGKQKADRRTELNQALWQANSFLYEKGLEEVDLVQADREWLDGEKVKTPYGNAIIKGFDAEFDMYEVVLDWRPLDLQLNEHLLEPKEEGAWPKPGHAERHLSSPLETVMETDEVTDDEFDEATGKKGGRRTPSRKVRPVEVGFRDGIVKQNSSPTGGVVEYELRKAISVPSHLTAEKRSPAADSKIGTSTTSDSRMGTSATSDCSSLSSISSDGSRDDRGTRRRVPALPRVTARVRGRDISKFTTPQLPQINKKSSMFSFWAGNTEEKTPRVFKIGDKCTTPYGIASVIEHRIDDKIVAVNMLGWNAKAFLKEEDVKMSREGGIIASLFRRQAEAKQPPLQFPHAKGTVIQTPYGETEVIRPLTTVVQKDGANAVDGTLCLSVLSWTLADGSHPKLYCTESTARTWKDTTLTNSKDGLFSAFGTLVSSTFDFAGRFSAQKTPDDDASTVRKVDRYYQDSAAVSTAFGPGRVLSYRELDGFYQVLISSWTLADGAHPIAWLREVDLKYHLAEGCQEGYPVLTRLGLTGTLESVQPTTGVHIVTVPSAGLVMYVQPEEVVRPLKAAIGESTLTAFGEGKVQKYDLIRDMYIIKLNGWNATLYAKAETFDRVPDTMRDRGGELGMTWLLGLFFSTTADRVETQTRSRSNSIVGSSTRSVVSQTNP